MNRKQKEFEHYKKKKVLILEERKRLPNDAIRKFFRLMFRSCLWIQRKINGFSVEILNDIKLSQGCSIIFAVTHIGKWNFEIVNEQIRVQSFVIVADFMHMYSTVSGFFMNLKSDKSAGSEAPLSGSRAAAPPSELAFAPTRTGYCLTLLQRKNESIYVYPVKRKLKKRGREVSLKLTRHNGRSGLNGVYNPRHNDRRFDVGNSEHIDKERTKYNIYWDCYRGLTTVNNREDGNSPDFSFGQIEKAFYYQHYGDYVYAQNERNEKNRHPERNRSVEYSCAMKSHFRKSGNQMSGKWKSSYASLLA